MKRPKFPENEMVCEACGYREVVSKYNKNHKCPWYLLWWVFLIVFIFVIISLLLIRLGIIK